MNHHTKLIKSAKMKGNKNPMFHKEHTEEARKKISEKIKKMWEEREYERQG